MKCQRCGHEWEYKGKRKYYTSCPNCKTSVKIKVEKKKLKQVPFTRLKYYADYCALTKRMGFQVRFYAKYSKNQPKKSQRKYAAYFPKYANYLYRNSNLSSR